MIYYNVVSKEEYEKCPINSTCNITVIIANIKNVEIFCIEYRIYRKYFRGLYMALFKVLFLMVFTVCLMKQYFTQECRLSHLGYGSEVHFVRPREN